MSLEHCTCNWIDMDPDPDCITHFPDPEMSPGILTTLDALTIRKATP
jgi:hypothetical protein